MFARVGRAFVSGQTISERVVSAKKPTTGFDYLRIGLAAAVVVWHSFETSGAALSLEILNGPASALVYLILPTFFALSGFLVCGSLMRTASFVVFGAHRALRLFPALCVEITLSALLIGPAFTELPLRTYFASSQFYAYLLNILGYVHFYLPGVFLHNPSAGMVNGSLWTIPFELECYLSLLLLSLIGLLKRKVVLSVAVVVAYAVFTVPTLGHGSSHLERFGPPGRLLVVSFVAGVTLYLWRDRLKLNLALFLCALGASLLLLSYDTTMYLAPFPAAYITVYLGMLSPPKIPLLMSGDYSYGLYLFAYPIQQVYASIFPSERVWWGNVLFTLCFGLAYAGFSWHCIEKPILSYRRQITQALQSIAETLASSPRMALLTRARRVNPEGKV